MHQLTIGVLFTVICIMVYNNLKPYAAWQNDTLQQICQLNIFLTMLVGVAARLHSNEDPIMVRNTEELMAYILLALTGITTFLAIPMVLLETVADPVHEMEEIGYVRLPQERRKMQHMVNSFRKRLSLTLTVSVERELGAILEEEVVEGTLLTGHIAVAK